MTPELEPVAVRIARRPLSSTGLEVWHDGDAMMRGLLDAYDAGHTARQAEVERLRDS